MNVLHIDSEKTWRGGQNQTRLLIEGMLGKGIATHLAASPDSMMLKVMQASVPTLPVKLRGGLLYSAGRTIAAYCKKHHITHLDAQGAKAHSVALVVKHRLPHLKLIVHRRVDFLPKNNIINRMKYLSKSIDAYVAISDAIGKILLEFGIPQEKVHVVKSCASPLNLHFPEKESAKQHLAKELGFDPTLTLIGNVSALTPQKDYPTLLKAAQILKNRQIPFSCLIAGAGESQKKLHAMTEFLDLQTHVRFLGFRQDVSNILQALDILAMPSKNEGLGTILLDAMQAGCCVVTTRVGGIPEVIKHRETGLLAEAGDFRGFAQCLEEALKEKDLRIKLNAAGQELVKREFSLKAMIEGNIQVYQNV